MLDLRLVREQPQLLKENIANRGIQADVDALLSKDDIARKIRTRLEGIQKRRNNLNTEIKAASQAERAQLVVENKALKEQETQLEKEVCQAEGVRTQLLNKMPNWTHGESPIGKDESSNRVLRVVGEPATFSFAPKDHLQLMLNLDLVDFERAAKVSGQKFYYLKNEAVLLEQSLINFALSYLQKKGFTLLTTPDLARQSIMQGIGFQPRDEATQVYNLENTDLSLVATSEITLGGFFSEEILSAEQLPLLLAGLSHCFRTEAGSAGKESKGLFRVHQFTKVEMFAFTTQETSDQMHQQLLDWEEEIYQQLQIPFRVVDICTGDLGAPAYRKFDLEAWMPGRRQWGEITSTSNCTDYQARRLGIRYKSPPNKGTRLVHMLNGTAIATTRTMIALLENGQQPDGSIHFPPVLQLNPIKTR